jgi:sRNA-binding regulator protein Hfq
MPVLISFFSRKDDSPMSLSPGLPTTRGENGTPRVRPQPRNRRNTPAPVPFHIPARMADIEAPLRHAELFYLQKQIQSQTPMIIVLEDGEHIDGCIEWYDRNSLKVRGKTKTLIYKSAIKYMYKLGDVGQ